MSEKSSNAGLLTRHRPAALPDRRPAGPPPHGLTSAPRTHLVRDVDVLATHQRYQFADGRHRTSSSRSPTATSRSNTPRVRTGRVVAGVDDHQVGRGGLRLGQHHLQHGQHPVHVGQIRNIANLGPRLSERTHAGKWQQTIEPRTIRPVMSVADR